MSEEESAGQMYTRLGIDGFLWAKEFVKIFPIFEEETARAWFCSAIMAGYDKAIFRMGGKLDNLEVENAKLRAVVEATSSVCSEPEVREFLLSYVQGARLLELLEAGK